MAHDLITIPRRRAGEPLFQLELGGVMLVVRVYGDSRRGQSHRSSPGSAEGPIAPTHGLPAHRLASAVGNQAFGLLVGRSRTPVVARLDDLLRPTREERDRILLQGSVGRGGSNLPDDVAAVTVRLNALGYASDSPESLITAITNYQRVALGFSRPDGRVDRVGQTVAGLNAFRTSPQKREAPPGPVPPRPVPPKPPTPTGQLEPGDFLWVFADKALKGGSGRTHEIPQEDWFPETGEQKAARGNKKRSATDYQGHGKEIFNYVIHASGKIRCGQPHMVGLKGTYAWLNNNPGNITAGASLGQYPGKANWHNFLIFPNEEIGFAAIRELLLNGRHPACGGSPAGPYRNNSILEAMRCWAPKGDGRNSPDTYAAQVVANCGPGVTLDTKIHELEERGLMQHMQDGIKKVEGTVPGDELTQDHPKLHPVVRNML